MKQHVGIIGSMFDPPHWGHYFLGLQAREEVSALTDIFLMPAKKHHWKAHAASPEQRFDMASLLAPDGMNVSRIELDGPDVSYTYNTVMSLKSQKDASVYWIIGSDNLSSLHRWYRIDQLAKEVTFIVFPRPGFDLSPLPSGSIVIKNAIQSGISSSYIRERVSLKKEIRGMTPDTIEAYIRNHHLYENH